MGHIVSRSYNTKCSVLSLNAMRERSPTQNSVPLRQTIGRLLS